jgi:hypothetical protein
MADDEPPTITCTVAGFRAVSGLAPSSTWKLISQGKLETITIGRRRLIVVASWRRLVAEQQAAGPGDARRNGKVAPLGGRRFPALPPTLDPKAPHQRKRGRPRKVPPIGPGA